MLTNFRPLRMANIQSRRFALGAACLALSACVAVPTSGPRPVQVQSADIAAERSLPASPGAAWPADQWWQAFDDPQLDALIAQGLENSPDLAVAAARFRWASGQLQAAGGALLPSLDAQGSVHKERRSLNNGFGEEIKAFMPRGWRNGGDLAASLDYELDLWGRNRAGLVAATSEADAAAIELRQARLLLASGIASAYADLAHLLAQRDIRQSGIAIRTAMRDLVASRHDNGLETRGTLMQAQSEVATARGELAATDRAIALRRNQLALLVGAGPDRGLEIAAPRLAGVIDAGVPADATTDLVGRRPDIVAARARMQAAAARVRVTRADFFPAVRLQGLIGWQSIGLGELFSADSAYGRAGPAVSLPLFHAGELRGRYRAATGQFDEMIADYNRTVLNAYREAADAVSTREQSARQLADARDALDASEQAYAVARLRYEGGLSAYLDVLAIEDRLLAARLTAARLEAETRLADIALIRALGGGYAAQPDEVSRK